MKTITLHLPHDINDANEREIRIAVAAILFDKSIISSEEAARFAGITKRDFLVTMGNYAHIYTQMLGAARSHGHRRPVLDGTYAGDAGLSRDRKRIGQGKR